jgi:hypothetical protein
MVTLTAIVIRCGDKLAESVWLVEVECGVVRTEFELVHFDKWRVDMKMVVVLINAVVSLRFSFGWLNRHGMRWMLCLYEPFFLLTW